MGAGAAASANELLVASYSLNTCAQRKIDHTRADVVCLSLLKVDRRCG